MDGEKEDKSWRGKGLKGREKIKCNEAFIVSISLHSGFTVKCFSL